MDWRRSGRRVLTLDWVTGHKLSDIEAIEQAGTDMPALGATIIQSFLRHALRDGHWPANSAGISIWRSGSCSCKKRSSWAHCCDTLIPKSKPPIRRR